MDFIKTFYTEVMTIEKLRKKSKSAQEPLITTAVKSGTPDTLKIMIALGSNYDTMDDLGKTIFHKVAKLGDIEKATVLLAAGADINAPDLYVSQEIFQLFSIFQSD